MFSTSCHFLKNILILNMVDLAEVGAGKHIRLQFCEHVLTDSAPTCPSLGSQSKPLDRVFPTTLI